ncbi:MAG: tRNA (adenosine(37)-N6)-dimethylallyltransferase MiaA [Anaerolineae bacterium]
MNGDPGPTKILVIVGPTAVGKTNLAVQLAQTVPSEAISADSRQIYRGMDIGTAKPSPEEQTALRHHLIDIVEPDQVLSLAQYIRMTKQAIVDITSRGLLPILVGGTGQYIRALLEGWSVPLVPPDSTLRAELYAEAAQNGEEKLHHRLAAVDPEAAARIDQRNVRRVVRALEVYLSLGKPISTLQTKDPPNYTPLYIGLTLSRPLLYQRVDDRIDRMLTHGLVAEVQHLVSQGYGYDLPSMSGLGYQQIGAYLRGEVTLEEAIMLIKRHTRRFVRHQYNWFRLSDPLIHWYNSDELAIEPLIALVRSS